MLGDESFLNNPLLGSSSVSKPTIMILESIPLTESLGAIFDCAPHIAQIKGLVKSKHWKLPEGYELVHPAETK